MIKYLIKFVSCEEHAQMLIDGEMFMRPASYYHHLETGQGDPSEAGVLDGIGIYMNSNIPIFCMYCVFDNDIIDGKILISKRVIEDFKCEDGFLVLLEYEEFEKRLLTVKTNGYQLDAGRVGYAYKKFDGLADMLNDKSGKSLFIKNPYFSYQKEFRIVIAKSVDMVNNQLAESVIYEFETTLGDITKKIKISELEHDDKNYYIQL